MKFKSGQRIISTKFFSIPNLLLMEDGNIVKEEIFIKQGTIFKLITVSATNFGSMGGKLFTLPNNLSEYFVPSREEKLKRIIGND